MVKTLQYFGTDGIRGTVGQPPMCEQWLEGLAKALFLYIQARLQEKDSLVTIAWDTRASGQVFAEVFERYFSSRGIQVLKLGVAPTPALALMTKHLKADLGLMITASHNPATDNGIKLFDRQGHKLNEAQCLDIEALLDAPQPQHGSCMQGATFLYREWLLEYKACLKQDFSKASKRLKVVLDNANGAMYQVAPLLLRELGYDVRVLGAEPNGHNINSRCGSEAPEALQAAVLSHQADIGIAFDGDGDRVRFCDEKGELVEGEKILALLALDLFEKNRLTPALVITTIHSNTGLDRFLSKIGLKTLRTPVGDKYILETMLETGAILGGEASGHLLFQKDLLVGDGLYGALSILSILGESEEPFSSRHELIELFPQVQAHIPVKEKRPLSSLKAFSQAIKTVEAALVGHGRVLARYSGTEAKLRVLIEGPKTADLECYLEDLKKALKIDLGELC